MDNFDCDNLSKWNGEKISQFLVWDLIDVIEKRGSSNFLPSMTSDMQNTTKKYNKYKFFVDFFDEFYNGLVSRLFIGRDKRRKKILLYNSKRYPSIAREISKKFKAVMIVEGKKDRISAVKRLKPYLPATDLYQLIYNYLMQRDENFLEELTGKLEKRIHAINPDYVVLTGDCLPVERSIILASKRLGITTVAIQDIIYQSIAAPFIGKVVDYVLVLGKHFKDLYVKTYVRKPEDIYILGYPQPIKNTEMMNIGKKHLVVCYLGSAFERYNKDLLAVKLKTLSDLNKICTRLGMKFIYRPHPGENLEILRNNLPAILFTLKGEKLEQTIVNNDIFIALNSTSLVEASLRSKLCLQLRNYPYKTDNFETLGICAKSFETTKQLGNYLKDLVNSSHSNKLCLKPNDYYIETHLNPGQHFLKILKSIDEKRNDLCR